MPACPAHDRSAAAVAPVQRVLAGFPGDAQGLLKLAADSMFDAFAQAAMGMLVVDREHRIVWVSEGYKNFLPALGFDDAAQFVGRRVEEVVPNTLMAQVIETGRPILVDLLTNQAGTFLVSRLPLRDPSGHVIGALGLVLLDHPESTMQPLITQFSRLQAQLDQARQQLAAQRRPKYSIASFIGSSPAALEVKRQARRVAAADATVLLLGETGPAQEVLAQAIHAASARSARPFIALNVAAVPENLLEAECFGVAPGAYTGADRRGREGKFKLADGSTLFLDEIGDLPLSLQSKLLRVLQEQEVEPIGSNRLERINVRVIAATSRDLPAMLADGRFRADLYYRLNVLPIHVPPLRERLDDIEALAETLLEDIARRSGLATRALAPDGLERLMSHDWPGNIRELRNTLEQAALMTDDLLLHAFHFERLPSKLAAGAVPPGLGPPLPTAVPASPPMPAAERPLHEQVAELEQGAMARALQASHGNRAAAARLLGLSRAAFYDRLERYPALQAMNKG
ncbi:MAG: sigma-54 interaction domain-containing protein [Rubrivivax sp.]